MKRIKYQKMHMLTMMRKIAAGTNIQQKFKIAPKLAAKTKKRCGVTKNSSKKYKIN